MSGNLTRSFRGKPAIDVERENFEKAQTASIQKAINSHESATKEKHARVVIIGTHHDKNAMLFWNVALRLPTQENPIVAWKFCHVVHKVLREGPAQAILDSARFSKRITDLGRLWGHLKEGYGRLISSYAKLVVQKITFHRKNEQIRGNLFLEDDQLDKICNSDINLYFELGVDMMDYMDAILALQAAVFGSLDMSRANSMTSSGQCRLHPLILCILDSCPLYDYIVKTLFRLHASLPTDTLAGHRDRFLAQYRLLRQFYMTASNLQYFKNLIKVPSLPDLPPNFLRASDLSSHVKPMVVIPEPDVSDVDSQNDMDMTDAIVDQLIDTSTSSQEESFQNGLAAAPGPDERDVMIEQLRWEVGQLKRELVRLKAEDQMVIESLHNRVRELEMEVNELRQIAESTTNEAEALRDVLKSQEQSADVASRLLMVEKIAKGNEEKFTKMKDIYTKLREEHIQLLRTHSDSTRHLNEEKRLKEDAVEQQRALSKEVEEMKRDKTKLESTLVMSSESATRLETAAKEIDSLTRDKQELEDRLKLSEATKSDLERAVDTHRAEATRLQGDLEATTARKTEAERAVELHRKESEQLKRDLETAHGSQTSVAQALSERASEVARLTSELDAVTAGKLAAETVGRDRLADNEGLRSELEKLKIENSSLSANVAERKQQLDDVTLRLDATAVDLRKETETSAQRLLEINTLQQRVTDMTSHQEITEKKLRDAETTVAKLKGDLEKLQAEHVSVEASLRQKMSDDKRHMIECAAAEGEAIVREALAQADNPHHSTITCTAEYLLNRTQPTVDSLKKLADCCQRLSTDENVVGETVKTICEFSHLLGDTVLFGFATAHTATIEAGEALGSSSKVSGDESLVLLSLIKKGDLTAIPAQAARVEAELHKILSLAEELVPKVEDVQAEQIGDMVDVEMQMTSQAIEEATAKIAAMLAASRENWSGIQLEVNEGILDSCNQLMKRIVMLIEKSKVLQKEIVAQGRGTSTAKDFYKKHHRWTEGLISAAKAVGLGANTLVDAADRVVKGKGKYEELVVCSQEIAASTTQLVVASKVKAARGSENLHQLADASKGVTSATGQVVACAKGAAQRIEEMDTMDFSKLTLHQAKRLEMEAQVHVLELESKLERERRSLSDLRKIHYKLAGESEGWDQDDEMEDEVEDAETGDASRTGDRFQAVSSSNF